MTRSLTFCFAVLTLTLALFSACKSDKTAYQANADIDQKIRTEIADINKKLFSHISKNDINGAKSLISDSLLQISGNTMDTLLMVIAEKFKTPDFKIIDEYYVDTTGSKSVDTIRSKHGNDNDYYIGYSAINKEIYFSLLTPPTGDIKSLALIGYGKYNDGWKINILQIGDYSVLDKTAPYFYKKAKEEYSKKHIIDAALSMVNTSQIARPARDNFVYNEDKEMHAFFMKVLEEANTQYKFPIVAKQIKTQPAIYFVNPQYVGEEGKKGIYPIVNYVSAIQLNDTVALKAENDELHKVIGQLFTGIDKNNSYITYSVSNKIPGGQTPIDTYGFVQKVK